MHLCNSWFERVHYKWLHLNSKKRGWSSLSFSCSLSWKHIYKFIWSWIFPRSFQRKSNLKKNHKYSSFFPFLTKTTQNIHIQLIRRVHRNEHVYIQVCECVCVCLCVSYSIQIWIHIHTCVNEYAYTHSLTNV